MTSLLNKFKSYVSGHMMHHLWPERLVKNLAICLALVFAINLILGTLLAVILFWIYEATSASTDFLTYSSLILVIILAALMLGLILTAKRIKTQFDREPERLDIPFPRGRYLAGTLLQSFVNGFLRSKPRPLR